MNLDMTLSRLNKYFEEKLDAHGANAKGVDYNSDQAQSVRFEQLVKVINATSPFTVIDYGCGYGAMFDFLTEKGWKFEYSGVDSIRKMVLAGQKIHKDFSNCHFTTDEKDIKIVDYLLAGSIFNIKLDASEADWQQYTLNTLKKMNQLCLKGFSFNMLTSYSDSDRMRQRLDLFYGDPCFYFDFCKQNFSKNVALLHDYGLYDFTILIRKDI
jgi:hypothetical protein